MTQNILFQTGEEYIFDLQPDGNGHDYLVYHDSGSDNLSDGDDLGAITTEPDNSNNYARQDTPVTTEQFTNDYGYDNDNSLAFDFSDVSGGSSIVDTAADERTFDSAVAGTNAEHIIANYAMSQDRDIHDIDSLDYSAGDLTLTVD